MSRSRSAGCRELVGEATKRKNPRRFGIGVDRCDPVLIGFGDDGLLGDGHQLMAPERFANRIQVSFAGDAVGDDDHPSTGAGDLRRAPGHVDPFGGRLGDDQHDVELPWPDS